MAYKINYIESVRHNAKSCVCGSKNLVYKFDVNYKGGKYESISKIVCNDCNKSIESESVTNVPTIESELKAFEAWNELIVKS